MKEERLMEIHLSVTIFASLLYSLMNKVVPVWSGGRVEPAALTTGLPDMKSAQMGEDLAALAAEASQVPDLIECLREAALTSTPVSIDCVPRTGSFWSAFTAFLEKHGHASTQEFELAHPRWKDDPQKVLDLMTVQIQAHLSGGDPAGSVFQQEVRIRAEREMGRCLGYGPKRVLFRVLLMLVQNYSVHRENLKYTFVKAHGRLRDMYLLLAGWLIRTGQLFDLEDIFYLSHEEIVSLIMAGISPGEAAVRANARRAELKQQQAQRHKNTYRLLEERPDGSLVFLPGPESILGTEHMDRPDILHGVAASSGRFRGKVRVIIDPDDKVDLQSGEILVTRSTNPAWSPLLLRAGALVTEIGGLLSHGAIVAREYGLPAVLNVKGVTGLVRTGQVITVDGYRGLIHLSESNGHNQDYSVDA
jgi:rifampicin phosphotransferase